MRSRILEEFTEEIQFKNRNPQNIRVLNLLDESKQNLFSDLSDLYSKPVTDEDNLDC